MRWSPISAAPSPATAAISRRTPTARRCLRRSISTGPIHRPCRRPARCQPRHQAGLRRGGCFVSTDNPGSPNVQAGLARYPIYTTLRRHHRCRPDLQPAAGFFETSSDEVRRAILKSERISGTQGPLLEAVHGVLLVTVLLAAIFTGTSLPVLATFLVLMNRVQPHLRTLEGTSAAFAAATAHLEEVEWLLDASNKAPAPVGVVPYTGLRDHIVFEKVTHDYGTRNAPTLTDVSFVLRRGRATALLGESGSGKSTIINLLCRLLEPTSGTIRVDGKPLHDLQVADWLSSVAIAGQDIELIDGTIAENLAYGRPETSRDEIEEAVRAAHADFVRDLPLGLDTPIGPGGLGLSGGQRQRIGLARALVRKPELLILDEATNALDYATEQGIFRVLEELRGAMTMLVVSHKADALAFCDDALCTSSGQAGQCGAGCVGSQRAGWLWRAEEGSWPLL